MSSIFLVCSIEVLLYNAFRWYFSSCVLLSCPDVCSFLYTYIVGATIYINVRLTEERIEYSLSQI